MVQEQTNKSLLLLYVALASLYKYYLDVFFHHSKTEFRMETKSVDIPNFIGNGYTSIVEFDSIVRRRNVEPSPISVQPIIEILYHKDILLLKSFGNKFHSQLHGNDFCGIYGNACGHPLLESLNKIWVLILQFSSYNSRYRLAIFFVGFIYTIQFSITTLILVKTSDC